MDAGTAAGGAPPPQEPAKPDLAAAVMERRTAASLAKLMAAKRDADAAAERVKGVEPAVQAFERARQRAEAGDHAGAQRELHLALYGDEARRKEALPKIYDSLTSEILGVESAEQIAKRQQAQLSHLAQQIEAQERYLRELESRRSTEESETRERRVESGLQDLSKALTETNDYPYLLAESDDPARVVWEIMVEAAERGEEVPEWDKAARMANDHFKPLVEKKQTRYQTLLAQGANGTPVQHESPPSQMGTQRLSLTNADSSQVPPLRTVQPLPNREASIEQAWRMLQERHLTK